MHFCAHADRVLPAALAPVLRERFALSDAELGLLHGTAFIIPYALATLATGLLWGRAEPRRVMLVAVVAWTVAGLLFAAAASYRDLILARVALGLGQAAFAPAAVAALSQVARPAVALSSFTAGSSAGRSGGLLIAGLLLTLAGIAPIAGWAPWRLASIWLLLPNLLLLALLIAWGPRARMAPVRPSGAESWLGSVRRRPRAFAAHVVGASAVILIIQAGGAWASSIVHRAFGVEPGPAATLTGGVILLAGPAGHLIVGRVLARSPGLAPGPVMAIGAAVAWAGCVLLAVASTLPVALAGVAVLSAAGGGASAAALIGLQPMVRTADRFPVNSAYFALVSAVGFGLGPVVTGLASDRLGGEDGLATALAAVVAAAAIVVAAAALAGTPAWRQVVAARDREDQAA